MEDLLSLDGAAERAAGSSEIAVVSSSDQGTEPGWPRVFHCDLNEDAELPLLAEPRLGAEQVGGLYAGEEVTAVGQHGDWLHVRLYEYEEDEEGEKDDDEDVSVRLVWEVWGVKLDGCLPRQVSAVAARPPYLIVTSSLGCCSTCIGFQSCVSKLPFAECLKNRLTTLVFFLTL